VPQWYDLEDRPEVLIVDECFVAGTRVDTPIGPRAIEEIVQGDEVCTPGGVFEVSAIFRGMSQVLVTVELENGSSFTTTPNHPVATLNGWRAAGTLQNGAAVLRVVQKDVQASQLASQVLQSLLRQEADVGRDEQQAPERSWTAHERGDEGPHAVESGGADAGNLSSSAQCFPAENGASTLSARRQWSRSDEVRTAGFEGVGGRLEAELSHQWVGARAGPPNLFQGRSGSADAVHRGGDRWPQPQSTGAQSARSKERALACEVRVARVSISERRDPVPVFNLEVAGCPLYQVGGVVVHNSTKYKNSQTQRFKLLRKILGTFRRRIILTGTPVPNGLLDLFGQIYILDLGNALGRFVTHYRNEYFFTSGFGNYEWSLQRGATERIYEKVRPITLRLAAEDYLTMPKKTDVTVAGVLPEKARKDYDQLIDLYLIAREDDTDPVTVENAAALSMKLRQVTGGFVYTESGATRVIHTAKLEMLADLIETLSGQPTLVAYQFQHEAEAIREELGIPLFKGSPIQIRSWVQQWNAGSLPALLIHPDTAGHGLNLQTGGHHLIWYSLPWNQEHYDQTFRRLWRQGQEFPVTQHHLIMRETVDELVLKTLGSKERVQKLFLDAMRKEVRRGRKV
jgi:hypothetical protein